MSRTQQLSSPTLCVCALALMLSLTVRASPAFVPSPSLRRRPHSAFLREVAGRQLLERPRKWRSRESRTENMDAFTMNSVEASSSDDHNNAPAPYSELLESDGLSYRKSMTRTLGWVSAAGAFGAGLFAMFGSQTGEEFFAGYLVEQSLSVDNLLVFLLLFDYFKVPLAYQDRVLSWGIAGAIVMRAVMIGLGSVALQQFHGVLLVFAGILVYGSLKFFVGELFGEEEEEEDPSQDPIVKFASNLFPYTNKFDGDRFFTMVDGIRTATPLLICMIAVEISDVVFAVDSIPAVFGVTENPLIVFSSNMFAIMGLRSLYTILSKAATDLKYLEPAVAVVLGFIGSKMIAEYIGYNVPTEVGLGVVASVLGTGIFASILDKQKRLEEEE